MVSVQFTWMLFLKESVLFYVKMEKEEGEKEVN